MVSISRALACADVAVLAVPARALLPFVAAYGHQLRGKASNCVALAGRRMHRRGACTSASRGVCCVCNSLTA